MDDMLSQNNEISMKWFDYYYRIMIVVFVVFRGLCLISYILKNDYLSAAVMTITVLLNASILYLFKPYKKRTVRKYPKKIFYLTMSDNIWGILNCVLNIITFSLSGLIQDASVLIIPCVLYILNIIYFVKRRVYFGIGRVKNIDTSNIGNKENIEITDNITTGNTESLNESVISENNLLSKNELLFCRKCGAKLPLDSDFCTKCGTRVIR